MESIDFENVKVTWQEPPKETLMCSNVEFIVDFVNTTSRGTASVDTDGPDEYVLKTQPGTRWEVRMRTQTVEDGQQPGQASPWSERVIFVSQGLPGKR